MLFALLLSPWRDSKKCYQRQGLRVTSDSDEWRWRYHPKNHVIFPWLVFCDSILDQGSGSGSAQGLWIPGLPSPTLPEKCQCYEVLGDQVSWRSSKKPPPSPSLVHSYHLFLKFKNCAKKFFMIVWKQLWSRFGVHIQEVPAMDWLKYPQMSKEYLSFMWNLCWNCHHWKPHKQGRLALGPCSIQDQPEYSNNM